MIYKNLIHMFRNERMITILILLSVFTSSLVLCFSYGLYQNYNVLIAEETGEYKELEIGLLTDEATGRYISPSQLAACVCDLSAETTDHIEMFLTYTEMEPFVDAYASRFQIRFCVENGQVVPCETFSDNIKTNGALISGSYFTAEQERNGEPVAIINYTALDSTAGGSTGYETILSEDAKTITLRGISYTVIGTHRFGMSPLLPLLSYPTDCAVAPVLYITFDRNMTRAQYEDMKLTFTEYLGDLVVIPELALGDAENRYLYRTILLISVLIALVSAINFAVLYRYILERRRKTLTIFRLCGCTARRVRRMYLLECLLLSLPIFALGCLVYAQLILPLLSEYFPYMADAYSLPLYLILIGIYLGVSVPLLGGMLRAAITNQLYADYKGEGMA